VAARTAERAAATAVDFLDGADADLDGIINAFDVSDDGDTIPDYADTSGMLTPPSSGDNCESAASFNLFSNFKATQSDFSGTINAYAQGTSYEATKTNTATALNTILKFAIQRITTVCGSPVTKTEFKGINVAYAPANYVTLPTSGSDVQWHVGYGQMSDTEPLGLVGYTFTCTPTCEISGQDTFMQRVTAGGKTYEFITSPTVVFTSHPMVVGVAVVPSTSTCSSPGTEYPMNSYGSDAPKYGSQLLPVTISSEANQIICVKIFRPQRQAVEGEAVTPVDYYDIGKLEYYPDIPNPIDVATGTAPGLCTGAKVTDSASDTIGAPTGEIGSNPTYTIAWKTADIKACFTSKSATWIAGNFTMDIQAVAPVAKSGNAAQKLYVTINNP
jgi:hypothetical protein